MKPPLYPRLVIDSASPLTDRARRRTLRSHRRRSRTLAVLGAAAILCLALSAGRAAAQGAESKPGVVLASGRAKSPANQIQKDFYDTWRSLSGTYSTPAGNTEGGLKLVLTANPEYRLFLELTGVRDGEKILQRGWIDLSINAGTYNQQLTVRYRPETIGKQFGCTMTGVLVPGGLTAESAASDCSFPLHERVSRWKLDASSAAIVVTDADGHSTRFERTSAN